MRHVMILFDNVILPACQNLFKLKYMPPEQTPIVPESPTLHRFLNWKVLWIILLVVTIAVCAVWYRYSRLSLLGPGEPCIPTVIINPDTNAYEGLTDCDTEN